MGIIVNENVVAELIGEIVEIARLGQLPDGDGVNVSTALWAERWWQRLDPKGYEAWLKAK